MKLLKYSLITAGVLALAALVTLGVYYVSPMNPDSPANRQEESNNPDIKKGAGVIKGAATEKVKQSTSVDSSTESSKSESGKSESSTTGTLDEKAKTVRMNVSQSYLTRLADQLTELSTNFSSECEMIAANSNNPEALQGPLNTIGNIQGELFAITPIDMINGGDFKHPEDYDYILKCMQAPIDKLQRSTLAIVDLTNKFYNGTATQQDIDDFAADRVNVQMVGGDIQILRNLADNNDLFTH